MENSTSDIIEIQNQTKPEMTALAEKNTTLIQNEISEVQNKLKSPLSIDNLWLDYEEQPFRQSSVNWYATTACFNKSEGETWGRITTGIKPNYGATFIESNISEANISILDHEIAHLITNETILSDKSKATWPISSIIGESVSICLEIQSLNSHQKEDRSTNTSEIMSHCQRIVSENQDNFLNPEKITGPNEFTFPSDIYRVTITHPDQREYDGFSMKRDLMHIAAINFGLKVLYNDVSKWKFVLENPPTMEEIVYPQKYLERFGMQFTNYKVQEIEPTRPTLLKNGDKISRSL